MGPPSSPSPAGRSVAGSGGASLSASFDGPPGSGCSIQIGIGLTDEPAGSVRNTYLLVTDLEAARSQLLECGVEVGEIRDKTPIGGWDGGFAPGLDPDRGGYASFADFSDPDDNSWILQGAGIGRRDSQIAHERLEQSWVFPGSKDR